MPTTTYGENIGVMAITKVYSVRVIGGAAVLSIICSFVGPLAALIQTIPGPVIGGISFLLYGMIGTSGLRILVDNHVDYSKNRNMILTSVIFVTGLSGVTLALGDVSLSGMTLAAIVGMIMSLVFYAFDKFHLSNLSLIHISLRCRISCAATVVRRSSHSTTCSPVRSLSLIHI